MITWWVEPYTDTDFPITLVYAVRDDGRRVVRSLWPSDMLIIQLDNYKLLWLLHDMASEMALDYEFWTGRSK